MEKDQKQFNILVIDDEPGWRDLLSLELSSEDCAVTTACNGVEALELLRQRSFDLVITDVRMPGEPDGIDLIQSYRNEHPCQKAIFITGFALAEKLEKALQPGAVVCIKKPFESQHLLNTIHTLLSA